MASTHKDRPRRHHEDRPRLPDIPDLRFEYSYVRSVRRFVQVERVSQPQSAEQEEYEAVDALHHQEKSGEVSLRPPSEVITVQWGKVFWVTIRDQVISPFVQGTLWALASYYLSPVSAQVGSRLGTYVHQKLPSKEGMGISWLRNKMQSVGLSRKNI
ncbi:hypothetical protein D9619_007877 [Psilocybe cf. subviscida]|uniref:Uncharacterized protein n=1 Tax=Psilocybe cf. subviscida TaxID=2480587 RepID=A0A8H5ESY0_9AGAR|nr:hypothetical protein D9619_007877 [Psilocybe cf. subviscida]